VSIIRLRDVLGVAWTGETFTGPDDLTWTFSLADLYSMTQPTDWTPTLATAADWELGVYDLSRDKAEEITTALNNSQPWEPAPAP
jgi:hypothetical protein